MAEENGEKIYMLLCKYETLFALVGIVLGILALKFYIVFLKLRQNDRRDNGCPKSSYFLYIQLLSQLFFQEQYQNLYKVQCEKVVTSSQRPQSSRPLVSVHHTTTLAAIPFIYRLVRFLCDMC